MVLCFDVLLFWSLRTKKRFPLLVALIHKIRMWLLYCRSTCPPKNNPIRTPLICISVFISNFGKYLLIEWLNRILCLRYIASKIKIWFNGSQRLPEAIDTEELKLGIDLNGPNINLYSKIGLTYVLRDDHNHCKTCGHTAGTTRSK